MLALFREIVIAHKERPDQVDVAYLGGLMTALMSMRLTVPFRIWCCLHGYTKILWTVNNIVQE